MVEGAHRDSSMEEGSNGVYTETLALGWGLHGGPESENNSIPQWLRYSCRRGETHVPVPGVMTI